MIEVHEMDIRFVECAFTLYGRDMYVYNMSNLYIIYLYRYLATSSADQTACIWKTDDLSLRQQLKDENQRWVWRTAFTNDSEHLLTGR